MPVCELCGNTSFVKEDGMFVCQGCGTKYTLEEAKKLAGQPAAEAVQAAPGVTVVIQAPSAAPAPPAPAPDAAPAAAEPAKAPDYTLATAADFRPGKVKVQDMGAREANNYACRGWQLLLAQYEATEHPAEKQQQILVERARECLALLDAASRIEPNLHVQGSIIAGNAVQIVDSAKATHFYTKNEDGTYKRNSLPFSTKFELPGQSESWESRLQAHEAHLRQEYIDAHPDDWGQRSALEAEAARIGEQLGELKDEKKSHGFFDFSGKKEVKERMQPVKEQLAGLRSQIAAYDKAADAYVADRIAEHGNEYVILDF